jgi:hypothetical protein
MKLKVKVPDGMYSPGTEIYEEVNHGTKQNRNCQ